MKHVKFGRIRGLSTRKGNVVLLTELLDEVEEAMKGRLSRSKCEEIPKVFFTIPGTLHGFS